MKKSIGAKILAFFAFFMLAMTIQAADDSALQKVEGNWEAKKTSEQGDKYTLNLQIKGTHLIFKMMKADGELGLYATGDVKAEKLGPFDVLKFTNIKAGRSESDLQDVDDDHVSIYQLRDGNLIMATNFEKIRENRPPSLDVYSKK